MQDALRGTYFTSRSDKKVHDSLTDALRGTYKKIEFQLVKSRYIIGKNTNQRFELRY